MSIKESRIAGNMTQSMLAQKSGVNFRSLQDYEQGHKPLSSASGDVLLRLASVLGCSVEQLLLSDEIRKIGAPVLPANTMTKEAINGQTFFCEQYGVTGQWVCSDEHIAILFYHDGIRTLLPFSAIFKRELIPWLKAGAVMMIEEAIEDAAFEKLTAR